LGDNLAIPDSNTTPTAFSGSPKQTWWGFPTWRETLSFNWQDPTRQVNDNQNFTGGFGQPNGLTPRPTSAGFIPIVNNGQDLPWMSYPRTVAQGGTLPNGYDFSIIRRNPVPIQFSDSAGSPVMSLFLQGPNGVDPVWVVSWEDDLVMTNVRSFDVKAYDNAYAGYADLGWADDLRLWLPYQNETNYFFPPNGIPPALAQTPTLTIWPPVTLPNNVPIPGSVSHTLTGTLAHEGRMPPIINDNRLDANYPNPTYVNPTTFTPQYPNFAGYSSNVGDNNSGVVRMRRTWDSWSTEYTQAPANSIDVTTGFMQGPISGSPPIYPSYPPPYPAQLRGIQIQIRVADPSNQRVKSLTIRQDFTDKL
jgi:hypothetical protein